MQFFVLREDFKVEKLTITFKVKYKFTLIINIMKLEIT